jgi:excisionase family DNA binding protein
MTPLTSPSLNSDDGVVEVITEVGMPEVVEFWSTEEVAAWLGVSEATVRYWLWQGIGPRSYKIGRRRKFKPADVKAWAEARASEPPSPSPKPRKAS